MATAAADGPMRCEHHEDDGRKMRHTLFNCDRPSGMMYRDVIRTHETLVKLLVLEPGQFGLKLLLGKYE